MDPSDVEDLDEYLKEGWIGGDEEKAGPGGEKHMKVETVNEKGQWTVTAVWGFVNIEGARYHARKLVCRKGEQVERVRGVYSWKGKV